jgi:hypothetical protein
MTLQQRQQQLIQQIGSINDEDILIMLEEELSYHLQGKTESSNELTTDELNELTALANEPSDKNTVSIEDYKKATARWRKTLR